MARRRRRTGKPAAETHSEKPEKQESWISTIAWALGIAFVFKSFLLDTFWIPSGSMEPTLDVGDFIVVTKWSYGYNRHSLMFDPPIFKGQRLWGRTPQRGDVVVFDSTHPQNGSEYRPIENGGYHVIKRVVGLPGDRVTLNGGLIRVESLTGEVFTFDREVVEAGQRIVIERNLSGTDRPIERGYEHIKETNPEGRSYIIRELQTLDGRPISPNGFDDYTMDQANLQIYFPDGRVPLDSVFVMGDNRDQSGDSRASVRALPMHKIVGKAQLTLFSLNDNWLPRWNRFFRPIR